ncbi:MAG TPA: endonuclease/exonuclease/phosphatase family protein [Actinomycetota bacterium]
MEITVGTFNLNNLFSRFNFRARVDAIPEEERDVTVSFEFTERGEYWFRTFRGRLIDPMPEEQRRRLAARIKTMDLDVLAVQEVEDVEALRDFNRFHLEGMYPHAVLVEGNDARFIDVAVLSKLPLGGATSWQHEVHPEDPSRPVFARDLLQVEVLNGPRTRRLLTMFINHLTSKFISFGENPVAAAAAKTARRRRQAETVERIVERQLRPDSPFVILGDMNDTPDSEALTPLAQGSLGLVDGLADPEETRASKPDDPPPATKAWTHRFKEGGQPARYELLDQIWLSPSLAPKQTGAFIERRTLHGGDGSDHDPAWVVLSI